MNVLDDGLGFALIIPIFFLLIPISISFIILYVILKSKNMSIVGSIIGLPCAFLLAFFVPVSEGQGIMWVIMNTDIIGLSSFAPYLMAVLFGILTAFIGLILIKIGKLSRIILNTALKH
jgi:hypothetical protein